MRLNYWIMTKIMKCSCGMKDVVKPKRGQTVDQYLQTRKCQNCRRRGEWRILSDEEATWD